MKFLSDILAKAGLTVDGVVTLNNTATGQTPAANDNSTKLATTAWVRTFVQPYSLPIASASILGGIKVGSGLSIDSGTGILSVTGGGAASIKSTQTFIATAGQTVFTITGGYTPTLIDVFLNGVYLSPNQTTATNGTTVTLAEAALVGDIIDVIVASPIYEGATTTTDQLPEGVVNLYYTNARARAAISLTVTGSSGASTYNSTTGVLNVPTYTLAGLGGVASTRTITINGVTYDLTANRSWSALPVGGTAGQLLAKVDGTDYNAQWINEAPAASYTSQIKHQVKASQAITKGQAVYVSSADGTNMIVSKASNAAEGTSSKTMGLLESTVSTNGFTNVIAEGLLSGLNTNGANAGDPVWLGTDGNLIYGLLNKPSAPAHLVFIGVVTRANANNGEIFVKVQNGFEMGELHDYVQNGVQDNYVISYESSTSLYKPKSIATLLGYTPANAARSLTINGTTYDLTADRTWTLTTSVIAEGTNLYYTDARVGTYLTNNFYATQTYVNTAVSNLVDAAPGTLDTLNELAAALGDDPNFATTVATSIGTKEPAITAGTTSQYWRGDKTWQTLPVYTLSGLGGVPTTRSLTINGTAYDLSADRSWTINSMVYPGAGIPLSTGTAWGTSITNNSANWNTAYGWGNHASAGYLTGITSSQVTTALGYTPYNSTNPNGYITSSALSSYLPLTYTATQTLRFDNTSSEHTTFQNQTSGAFIQIGFQQTDSDGLHHRAYIKAYKSSAGNYSGVIDIIARSVGGGTTVDVLRLEAGQSPKWSGNIIWHAGNLTNLNQLSNGPGYITGYTETDTLASVTSRGASTASNITLTGNGNTFSGHHYFSPYDVNGNHYPHYNAGSNANGSKLNLRMFDNSGNAIVFHLNGSTKAIEWNGNTVYHSGNLTNLNQLSNGPGYITSYTETDTLASVTGRGASTSTAISINNTLTVTSGRVIARTGGANTYGIFSGYDNSNHLIVFRAMIGGSDASPTFTAGHQTCLVEYAEANDTTGWFFKTAQTGNYAEVARITRTGITWNGNTVIHAGNIGSYTAGAANSVAWGNVSSKPGDIMYYAGFTLDADTMPSNSTGFTYSVNAPLTGPIVKFSTGGGYDLQINAPYYWGNEMYFRVRNGDLGVWRSWKQVLNAESHSYAANMNQYVRTSDNVAFNALSLPDGGRIIVNGETDTWGIRFRNTVSTSNLGGQLKNIIWTGGGALEGLAISGVGTGGAAFEIQNNGNAWAKNNIHAQNLFATAAAGRIQAGNSSTDGMLYDSSRAALVARGAYPHIELWSDAANDNHGGTLRFGGYDNGSSGAFKSWHIGTPGQNLYFMDIGYGGTSNSNPHAGIAGLGASYGYAAAFTIMRFHNNGNIGIGNFGTYGSLGDNTPAYKLDVRGNGRFTSNVRIHPVSESWAEGLTFVMPTTSTWGGLRWQRQRGNADGNWGIGYTANDSSDNLQFVGNYGGIQNNNILTLRTDGSLFAYSPVGTDSHGRSARFVCQQNGSGNFVPYSFESDYGTHSWGIVTRFRINQSGADRPSIQFSAAGGDDRWSVGYCTSSDWNFRITQNQGYRNDNSTQDGWGTERFKIDTGGTLWANGVLNLGPDSGNDQGLSIRYGSSGYGRIRFHNDGSNHSTIHSFGNSWAGGVSVGCININGSSGVTFGAWNVYDAFIPTGGSAWFRYDVTAYSDARVKTDIININNAVSKVQSINGVTFTRTDKQDGRRYAGVIAQEVLDVLPEVVSQDEQGMYSVSYGNMAGLFIEAIKEQQVQIESQKSEIEELKDLVKQLINR
jgi:hypothetical protein